MKLKKNPLTQEEFEQAKTDFLAECEKGPDGIVRHKSCRSPIRVGYMNCFKATAEGALDPGDDGCGIGPIRVPYCEKCDPPDGFNYTYAIRVGILPSPKKHGIRVGS